MLRQQKHKIYQEDAVWRNCVSVVFPAAETLLRYGIGLTARDAPPIRLAKAIADPD
jgi:hypothetical protein